MIMTKARKHPEEENHERMAKVCTIDMEKPVPVAVNRLPTATSEGLTLAGAGS